MVEDARPGLGRDVAIWLRGAVKASSGRRLGSGYQATVHLYTTPAGNLVVKKAHTSKHLGFLWRYMLRREDRVYALLRGIPGVPRSFGMLDDELLVLEHISGPSLRAHETSLHDRERFFDELLKTLQAMHAAGVVHGDLKRKDNIIVGPGERPYLIDFGVAWLRSRSALLNRLWFEPGKQMDYNAWIKLKYQRRTDAISPADAPLYRPLIIERIARGIRIPWQKLTMRRPRQRWRRPRRHNDE